MKTAGFLKLLLIFALRSSARADPAFTTPLTPFRIADNLYYVGSRDLGSFLIVTPQGDILINSNLVSSPPLIRHSVEQLGFHFSDIRILLISHAHSDHAGGSAAILRQTHAQYMVMDGDVAVVESGGAKDFAFPKDRYPATHVDRVLHDGDAVRLSNVVLIAHKTPGHTRGCTTWTLRTTQHGQPRNVVIFGSASVLNYRLVARPGHPASYPGIAQDFEHTFQVLPTLPCDIFLGAHGRFFSMLEKLHRAQAGAGEAVWVDPAGYRASIAQQEQAFRAALDRQRDPN